MIVEVTGVRIFRVSCDYCHRNTEVKTGPSIRATQDAYAHVQTDGWDLSGPYDRCAECVSQNAAANV